MKKVAFVSLGCPKNLVDTEVMLKKLYDAGFEITPDETEADVVIINTCGFIESAKKESIENIQKICFRKDSLCIGAKIPQILQRNSAAHARGLEETALFACYIRITRVGGNLSGNTSFDANLRAFAYVAIQAHWQ